MLGAAKTRKRGSKKDKSTWRKIDNKDVEEFMEHERMEERIGSVAEKADEELFAVDINEEKPKQLTTKQKRKLEASKPARSFEVLVNTSNVRDPVGQRNKVKKKSGRNLFEEVLNPVSKRIVQANSDRMKYYSKLKQSKHKRPKDFGKNLWTENDLLDEHPQFKNQWITRQLAEYHLKNTGVAVVKAHESAHHKTSKAKVFEIPHPGMSYNPSFVDHQDLLEKVVEKEAGIIKEEKHLKRVTTDMFSKESKHERDNRIFLEMSADNDEAQSLKATEESDGDEPYNSVNPSVQNKKKDRKARRKQKEQKELQQAKEKKKSEKRLITDLHRLKNIQQAVSIEEEELNKLKKHRKQTAEQKKFEPRRISRHKFKELEIDVNMAENIPGNLRNVKPESNLITDRFKSLQKRNILPTTVQVGPKKKAKVKRFVRSSHREVPQISKGVKK